MENEKQRKIISSASKLWLNWYTARMLDKTYLVTLKTRSNRRALSTERPKEPDLNADQITSKIEPLMTTQSNRLNEDSK